MSNEAKSERRERLLQSVSAAVFIEDNEGRLLLLKQNGLKGGRWGPPAGGVEYGESPEDTAIREAREEIGLLIHIKDLIGIYPVKRGEGYPSGLGFVYRAQLSDSEQIQLDGEEVVEARFFEGPDIDELIQEDKIYKPEFNLPGISDWKENKHYPRDVVKSIIDAEGLY